MPFSEAIVRDPPLTKRFRLIAPVLVLLSLALLAMLPGILVHIAAGEHDGATASVHRFLTYQDEGR
jgi:hypothetical protein